MIEYRTLQLCECNKCHHRWHSTVLKNEKREPKKCPKCKSRKWNYLEDEASKTVNEKI